ncbi:MAG: efflux RND transporter periplasmic adaptor subunit [Xanthobacteraceae bacterium]
MTRNSGTGPNRRRLMLVATGAVVCAVGIAGAGLLSRARHATAIAKWTDNQAVPTVTLAKLNDVAAPQTLTLPGAIQPYNKASLYARVNGYLKNWNKDIGAHVKAGEVLASIDAPDLDQQLAQAKATLASAKANYEIAAVTANRYESLVKKQAVAQQLADQTKADADAKKAIMDANDAAVRQLEAMQSFTQIVAPFDGVVTSRNTDIGALISSGSAGQPLMEISDLQRVRIYVQVPQAYSAQVRPGLNATFDMPQYPGQHFSSTVITMSNAFDLTSRSMQFELEAENADGKLFGGAYAEVHFTLPSDPNVVRVPATALVPVNQGTQIAILNPDNTVTLKSVQLGRDFGTAVEVIAGLNAQDRVIDSPLETLRSGDTVRLAAAPATLHADTGSAALVATPTSREQ